MIKYVLLILFLFLFPQRGTFAFGNNVVINEIAWMGSPAKSGETSTQASNNEWIELYNPTSEAVSLNNWKLSAQDGTPDVSLAGTIVAGGYFLLERTSDDTVSNIAADQIYSGAMSNSGEYLFLKNASGVAVDEINNSGGWLAGDNNTKMTMQLVNGSWVTASSTPKALNYSLDKNHLPVPDDTPTPSIDNSDQSQSKTNIPISLNLPTFVIKAYAGEDKVSAAGSLNEFIGYATNYKNEVLENIRFWWNFGDGGSQESRVAEHIFSIPGQYMVGLHVSSGLAAASDYVSVKVIPNQIFISSVLIGENGFIKLNNPDNYNIDIGEWVMEDGIGKKFLIPAKTKIGAKSEIALANNITGIFKIGDSVAKLLYPNGTIAVVYNGADNPIKPSSSIIATSSEKELDEVKNDSFTKNTVENKSENTEVKNSIDSNKKVASVQTAARLGPRFFGFLAVILSFLAGAGYLLIKKN